MSTSLRVIHFNDVYHVFPGKKDPVGGAERFSHELARRRNEAPTLVLCSGDVFSPSVEATITKGKHMVPVLNHLQLDACLYGNHDFDFGVPHLQKLADQCNFPFLLSNVTHADDQPLAGALKKLIFERNGLRIGVLGVVEEEWLETIKDMPPIRYMPFIDTCEKLATELREMDGCHVVIALTHMRVPNDVALENAVCPGKADVILGGHDHFRHIKGRVVKSGTDFREFSIVNFEFDESKNVKNVSVESIDITMSIPLDPSMTDVMKDLKELVDQKLSKCIGKLGTALDSRTESVRTRETNVGNWIADIVRASYQTDISLVVGGTIRADCIIEAGDFTMRHLMDLLPYEDPVVVVEVTGEQVWKIMENGVSMFPKQEGRFPQISGLCVQYDTTKPPQKRVVTIETYRNDIRKREPLDLTRKYTLATRIYIAEGNDGYAYAGLSKTSNQYVSNVNEDNGCLISELIRRYFVELRAVHTWQSNFGDEDDEEDRETVSPSKVNAGSWQIIRQSLETRHDEENKKLRKLEWPAVSPMVEGRLIDIAQKQ